MENSINLSVVVPVYNEEESVLPLYKAVLKSVKSIGTSYELVLVDDGSSDNTYLECKKISETDENVKVIKLKANSGQTPALHAGLQYATGNVVITMDGDLQNDPDDFGKFIEKINEGYDIVLGWREKRQDKVLSKKIPSKIANWLIRKLTGLTIKDNGCAIRAYKGHLVKRFPMYSEMHRLMPVMTALAGAKYTQISVKHHSRQFGSSKYGLSRIYKVLMDMVSLKIVLTNFKYPLYGFGFGAAVFFLLSMGSMLLTLLYSINNPQASIVVMMGVTTLLGSLSLFLIFMGIISLLVYKTGDLKVESLLNFHDKA
ncbi:MAG: glycosyltransferase family 2 protein [Melioribacteraceae bacterium]|nr:glycosyltransferase family 2 protein [Melioribacteraceae bacterium]